jgi:hypothetical protein
MLTLTELDDCADYVAGSCQMGSWIHHVIDRQPTDDEEEQVLKYLHDMEIYECPVCGWWTHPGEGDGYMCDDCCIQEEEDEEN